jgi:hypothetical protein
MQNPGLVELSVTDEDLVVEMASIETQRDFSSSEMCALGEFLQEFQNGDDVDELEYFFGLNAQEFEI